MNIATIIEDTRSRQNAVEEAGMLLEAHFVELTSMLKPRFQKFSEAAKKYKTLDGSAHGQVGYWHDRSEAEGFEESHGMLVAGVVGPDTLRFVNYVYLPVRYLDENWEELLAADVLKAQSEADQDD